MDYFSIMPVDIFLDSRLSKTDLRVLGAIMSWRNKDTNLCHPSREQISERCGLPVSKISTTTTRLVKLGWMEKSGNGGRSMRCSYKFKVPDLTVADSDTVTEIDTVTDSTTKTVPDSVTKTVPDSGRGKKLKDNLKVTKSIKENNKKKSYIRDLLPDISDQTFNDFVEHRKNKRALITRTAVIGLEREAEKAGISLENALIETIERGWIGFKAEWYLKSSNQTRTSGRDLEEEARRHEALERELFGKKSEEKDITNESSTL
ncbi:MAG: helix-turn-helix domain-containing protein [Gammaproteobacteria bacterium]|nr:helix-turn-helix domain-containing protein [Gammaproteobacteria bacterium]